MVARDDGQETEIRLPGETSRTPVTLLRRGRIYGVSLSYTDKRSINSEGKRGKYRPCIFMRRRYKDQCFVCPLSSFDGKKINDPDLVKQFGKDLLWDWVPVVPHGSVVQDPLYNPITISPRLDKNCYASLTQYVMKVEYVKPFQIMCNVEEEDFKRLVELVKLAIKKQFENDDDNYNDDDSDGNDMEEGDSGRRGVGNSEIGGRTGGGDEFSSRGGREGGTNGGGGDCMQRPYECPLQQHPNCQQHGVIESTSSETNINSEFDYSWEPSTLFLGEDVDDLEVEFTEDVRDLDWSWDGQSPWLPWFKEEITINAPVNAPVNEQPSCELPTQRVTDVAEIQAADVEEEPKKRRRRPSVSTSMSLCGISENDKIETQDVKSSGQRGETVFRDGGNKCVFSGTMCEEKGRVVLIGKTGSGKSTLANMLVSGKLEEPPLVPIGSGVRGTTTTCKTYQGRGWTVIDTMGFGEPAGGTVPDEDARKMVIDFLKEVKGRYSHIIFVREKGRSDMADAIIWETFRQIFSGGEKNFVVLYTKVDDPHWLDENREEIRKDFPECNQFLHVDFPGVDTQDSEMEELNAEMRQEELERLEMKMGEIFRASPWVEPDIYKMGDEEIKEKANSILIRIAVFIKELMKDYGMPALKMSITIFVSVTQLIVMFT